MEGVLWLQLSGESDGRAVAVLSFTFLVFAKVLWPSYTALAVLLIEPDRRRRYVFGAVALIGSVVSLDLLIGLLNDPPTAAIQGNSIAYTSSTLGLSWQEVPYLLCTALPPLLSSHKTIRIFGAVVLIGFLISAYVYVANFVSVWCFFAAADSTLLYFYFKRAATSVRLGYR